jgi:hypothetical protein
LDEEIREIKEGLILSRYKGNVEIVEASRPKDIQIAIINNQHTFYENQNINIYKETNDELITNYEQNINYDDYGKQDSENFREVFGFDAPPQLRKAIYDCYHNSKNLNPHFFKICKYNNYLDINTNTGKLKIVYSKSNKITFQYMNFFEIIIFLLLFIVFVLTVYVSWKFFFSAIVLMIFLCLTQPYTRPYRLAKRIESEIKEINK